MGVNQRVWFDLSIDGIRILSIGWDGPIRVEIEDHEIPSGIEDKSINKIRRILHVLTNFHSEIN